MDKISLSVVVPNHNEKAISETVQKLKIVCSEDPNVGLYEIITSNDSKGIGYGWALKRGINQTKYQYIAIIDADLSYSPWDLPLLTRELNYADMIVAERRGTVTASGLFRSIGRKIIKDYARIKSGFPIYDINSGLRIFPKSMYDQFYSYLPDKFSLTTTITLIAFLRRYKVKYVPVFYNKREGKTSLKPWEFFKFINTVNKCLKKS